MSVTVKVEDGVTPALRQLQQTLASGEIENAIGRGASNFIQRYMFKTNSQRPNSIGGPRTNFYAACARSVSYTHRPGQAEITIGQLGFRQRLEGGEILPRKSQYLTIPASPAAYGKRAREMNLRFAFAMNSYGAMQPALIFNAQGKKRSKQPAQNTVMFWLTKRVNQKADPSVLPPEADIINAGIRGADEYLRSKGGAT